MSSGQNVCFFCEPCGITFSDSMSLSRHKVLFHFHETHTNNINFMLKRKQAHDNSYLLQKCAKVSNHAAIEASLEAHKKRVQAQVQNLKEKADRERDERRSDVEKQRVVAKEATKSGKPKSEKKERTRAETGRVVDSKTEDLNREMKINFEKERRGKLKRELELSQQKPSPSKLLASRSSTRKNVSQLRQENKFSTLNFDNDVQEMIEVSPDIIIGNFKRYSPAKRNSKKFAQDLNNTVSKVDTNLGVDDDDDDEYDGIVDDSDVDYSDLEEIESSDDENTTLNRPESDVDNYNVVIENDTNYTNSDDFGDIVESEDSSQNNSKVDKCDFNDKAENDESETGRKVESESIGVTSNDYTNKTLLSSKLQMSKLIFAPGVSTQAIMKQPNIHNNEASNEQSTSSKLNLFEHPDQPVLILNPGSDDAKYVSIDTGEDYDDIAEKDDEDLEPAEGGGSDQEVLSDRRDRSWLNAFTLWSNQIRREMLEKDPATIFPPDLLTKLKLRWKAMSAAQRHPYYIKGYNVHGSEKKYPKPVDVLLKKREPNYNPQPVPVEVLLKRREPKTAAKPLTARSFRSRLAKEFTALPPDDDDSSEEKESSQSEEINSPLRTRWSNGRVTRSSIVKTSESPEKAVANVSNTNYLLKSSSSASQQPVRGSPKKKAITSSKKLQTIAPILPEVKEEVVSELKRVSSPKKTLQVMSNSKVSSSKVKPAVTSSSNIQRSPREKTGVSNSRTGNVKAGMSDFSIDKVERLKPPTTPVANSNIGKTISPSIPKAIQCEFCDISFVSDLDYSNHANEEHRRLVLKSWLKCDRCPTYHPNETLLSRHKIRNHFHQMRSLQRSPYQNHYYTWSQS